MGAWYVTVGTCLSSSSSHFDGKRSGLNVGTTAIAAIVSPLITEAIADRFSPAQELLAALHLVGGGLLFAASQQNLFVLY